MTLRKTSQLHDSHSNVDYDDDRGVGGGGSCDKEEQKQQKTILSCSHSTSSGASSMMTTYSETIPLTTATKSPHQLSQQQQSSASPSPRLHIRRVTQQQQNGCGGGDHNHYAISTATAADHHLPFTQHNHNNIVNNNSNSVFQCCAEGNESSLTSSTAPMLQHQTHHQHHHHMLAATTTTKSGTELLPVSEPCVAEIFDSSNHGNGGGDNGSTASTESRYVVPPDGGWGWVVVVAAFFICFIVDSVAYSYPMIYANLMSMTIEGPVAFFIGATLLTLYQITAPFASALVNVYGTRRVIVLGSILTSTGLIVSSRTAENDYYWLILTFGVMGGVGLGMMYIGAMVSVGTYFDKRRPLALALAVCGSGLGMGVFPLVAHHLFDHFGLGPSLELYACFVLQGAWLGMLVWPLPPRPLHACAKPRRKDLLDRVTEWVDKLRHREDSCDSLNDPDAVAERNKMVRRAAQNRIVALRRFESGLATPPQTNPSSQSSVCLATSSSTAALANLGHHDAAIRRAAIQLLMNANDPMAQFSAAAATVQFRRCTSVAVSRHRWDLGPPGTTRSCPAELDSLLWTPLATHELIQRSDDPKKQHQQPQQLEEVGRKIRNRRRRSQSTRQDPAQQEEVVAAVVVRKSALKPSLKSKTKPVEVEDVDEDMMDDLEEEDNIDNIYRSSNRHRKQTTHRNAFAHHGVADSGGSTGSSSTAADFSIMPVPAKPSPLLSVGCCQCVKKALEQSLDISLLRDSRFWILALGNIAAMMGLYQIIFVMPALAAYTDNDDSLHITSVIMAIFGVTHTIGRVLTGVMSGPRFRPLLMCNTAFVLSMLVFGVFAVAQEPLAYPVLCALAALHGLCYAFFAVLSTVIIVNVFGVRKLSSCFGMITLARGLAPYLTTLAYQLAYEIGTKSNIIGASAAHYQEHAETSLLVDGSQPSEFDAINKHLMQRETLYVQRIYGVAGIIYVGFAFMFHLLLHFRYFKRRLLDVQLLRKPTRPRLRCVSVPTPSSLSGYRLPHAGGVDEDDEENGGQDEDDGQFSASAASATSRRTNPPPPLEQETAAAPSHEPVVVVVNESADRR